MIQARKIRIAILHVQITQGKMHQNHKILGEAMAIAAGYGCQIVLTGELEECGACFWQSIQLDTVPSTTYPYLESLKEIAYKYKMHIVLGRAEREAETGNLFSTYTYISKVGRIEGQHRKQILESEEEERYLGTGNQLTCIEVEGIKIGLLIGYDKNSESVMNAYKQKNVELIICGVTPVYHSALEKEVSALDAAFQPIIFCNYDLEMQEIPFIGESICLGQGDGMIFKPEHAAVIVIEYDKINKKFETIKSININQLLH